jgi:hypothetical protein
MDMHRNNLLARKAITERAHRARSFVANTRAMFDRSQGYWFADHGLALPEAGDSIA